MIRLFRRRANIPKAFRQPQLHVAAPKLVELYYNAPAPSRLIFKSSSWKPAKPALKRESYGKCAYCEAPTGVVCHADVEHFRPKSKHWWLALSSGDVGRFAKPSDAVAQSRQRLERLLAAESGWSWGAFMACGWCAGNRLSEVIE